MEMDGVERLGRGCRWSGKGGGALGTSSLALGAPLVGQSVGDAWASGYACLFLLLLVRAVRALFLEKRDSE